MKSPFFGEARALFAALTIGASLLAWPPAASAQSASDMASARELFKEGLRLRAQGDFKSALDAFRAARDLATTPITMLELGRAHMDVGELVEARETFLALEQMAVRPEETDNSKAARAQAVELVKQLNSRIPSLTVKLQGLPPGASAEVIVDGRPIPPATIGTARVMNPGPHVVVAKAGSGPETTKTVDLKEGESIDVVLAPEWVPPKTQEQSHASLQSDAPERRATHPLVWVGLGVTVVGGAAGTALALGANSKARAIEKICTPTTCPESREQEVRDLQSSGKTLRNLAIGGFAVAGIGAALIVWGLAKSGEPVEDKKRGVTVRPWVSYGSAGLMGSFR